jgi:transposase
VVVSRLKPTELAGSLLDDRVQGYARLHKEWRATHVEDFVLDYLRPYSPELNPIERVWKLTRRQCLHNRYFPVLEEVVAAVEKQFENWRNGNETLRRLCAIT